MRFLVIVVLFGFAVAGSAFLAKVGMRGGVEAELAENAARILAEAGFAEVRVAFDHLEGTLTGTVDRPGDVAKVVELLKKRLPAAHWPEPGATAISIRPTLAPRLKVVRSEGGDAVRIEGVLSALEDSGRSLLGSRIHSLPGVASVDNAIALDPMVLPFPNLAEFISLASGLLVHAGAVEIALNEGDLLLAGTVPNEGLKSSLLELASGIGTVSLDDRIRVKPPATYTRVADLKITRNRFGVVLNGLYPSEAARAELLAVFREVNPSMTVTDRLQIADHCAPAIWQESLRSLVPVLLASLTGELTAEFTADQIRVSGVAPDEGSRRGLLDRLAPLGGMGLKLDVEIHLEAEKAVTAVELTAVYEGGLLVIKGKLPNPEIVAAIESRIRDRMPELLVKNEVSAAPESAGDEWAGGLVEFFAEALVRVSSGVFTFRDGTLELEGRTVALPDRQWIQNLAVNLLPPRFKIQNHLLHADQPFPKPVLQPEQRTQLAEALKSLPVYFEKNSEVLEEKEKAKVNSIADAVKAVNGAEVSLVVTGFADNKGDAERNQELSLRRAESVRTELIRLGLPEASLEVASKGEDVSGISRSELWKSRRVEVTLKPVEVPRTNP
jgi:OOP family OmpA-OmpF porin